MGTVVMKEQNNTNGGAVISTNQFPRLKRKTLQRNGKSYPRIALLTPDTGGNFGDAGIQAP
jgi:hypothetical protein